MSVVDLAGDGVARDDELCDALAERVFDGIPLDDAVASELAQWCEDLDRDPPAIALPTASLAAAAARRRPRHRTVRVVAVAAAVLVICLGGLTIAQGRRSPAPQVRPQVVSTAQSASDAARAQVRRQLQGAQADLAAHRWAGADAALARARDRLPAVRIQDGRTPLSAWLVRLQHRLDRAVTDANSRPKTTPKTTGTTTRRHAAGSAGLPAQGAHRPSPAQSHSTGQIDGTAQDAAAPTPTDTSTPPVRRASAPPRPTRPRPTPPRRSRPRPAPPTAAPSPTPPVKRIPILGPAGRVRWRSYRPPPGFIHPGIGIRPESARPQTAPADTNGPADHGRDSHHAAPYPTGRDHADGAGDRHGDSHAEFSSRRGPGGEHRHRHR